MSNQIYIDCNKVENVVSKTIHYEIKTWDNYNSGDTSIGEDEIPANDLDCLQYCKDYGSDASIGICDVIDGILEFCSGVTINATWYEWEEIKHIFGVTD